MASLWWSFRGRHLPAGTGIGEWKVAIKGAFERDGFSDVRLTDLEVAGGKDGCWVSVAHFRVAEREFWEVVMAAGDQARAVVEHTVATIAAIRWVKRLTGADKDTNWRWKVAGTDLGIPYLLENGSVGYLFGDTFSTAWPEEGRDWRAPVMLRSNVHPASETGIVFDSAAKVAGDGLAPEILDYNAHHIPGGAWPDSEVSCIPNDGISFPETGRQVISFQSINRWGAAGEPWRSRYASLAYSDNGNDFVRVPNLAWWNTESNTDPFQMWTMQRDGEWVYVFSVRSGRQRGPMMLQRVRWQEILIRESYQGWGWNGTDWGWGRPPTPILEGTFGEPCVRKLADGTWAMCYLNCESLNIVSRTAPGPDRVWSPETVQVTFAEEPNLYGGFIHPWSTRGPNNLHLMVSKWTRNPANENATTAYHVSQYVGTL